MQLWANKQHLLVVVYDVSTISVVDINGALVVVLQRGSNQQVSEAIVVQVRGRCQCVTKPGVLGLVLRLQGPIRDKQLLLGEKKRVSGFTGRLRNGYGPLTRV